MISFHRNEISPKQEFALATADETLRVTLPRVLELADYAELAAKVRELEPVTTAKTARKARRALDKMYQRIKREPGQGDATVCRAALGSTVLALLGAAGDSEWMKLQIREKGADPSTLYDDTMQHASGVAMLARAVASDSPPD